jgi:hypothetical protein
MANLSPSEPRDIKCIRATAPARQKPTSNALPVPLGCVLKSNGRTYTQVERSGDIAIYESPVSDSCADLMYEVAVIRAMPAKTMPDGTELPFREVYPTPESWGRYGFTFTRNSHHNPLQAARAEALELAK